MYITLFHECETRNKWTIRTYSTWMRLFLLPASFRASDGASGGGGSGRYGCGGSGRRGGRSRASVYSGDDSSRLLLLLLFPLCTLL